MDCDWHTCSEFGTPPVGAAPGALKMAHAWQAMTAWPRGHPVRLSALGCKLRSWVKCWVDFTWVVHPSCNPPHLLAGYLMILERHCAARGLNAFDVNDALCVSKHNATTNLITHGAISCRNEPATLTSEYWGTRGAGTLLKRAFARTFLFRHGVRLPHLPESRWRGQAEFCEHAVERARE